MPDSRRSELCYLGHEIYINIAYHFSLLRRHRKDKSVPVCEKEPFVHNDAVTAFGHVLELIFTEYIGITTRRRHVLEVKWANTANE